jgi:phosphohistidine phosphatase
LLQAANDDGSVNKPESFAVCGCGKTVLGEKDLIEIYIMRHGIAADLGENGVLNDADRPLTLEGRAKLKQAAQGLRELGLKFNVIFTSPLLRARQTAEVVAEVLDLQHKVKMLDSLAPGRQFAQGEGGHAEIFLELGAYQFDRALLVGHMPDLSELASYLLTGNRNLHVEFKKGSVCAIEVSSLPPRGPGLLRWLATPKQLRLMNKGK